MKEQAPGCWFVTDTVNVRPGNRCRSHSSLDWTYRVTKSLANRDRRQWGNVSLDQWVTVYRFSTRDPDFTWGRSVARNRSREKKSYLIWQWRESLPFADSDREKNQACLWMTRSTNISRSPNHQVEMKSWVASNAVPRQSFSWTMMDWPGQPFMDCRYWEAVTQEWKCLCVLLRSKTKVRDAEQ
jgi:hypothetical protein